MASECLPGPVPLRATTRVGPPSGTYIPTLDGWRAIAILLVMVYHAHFQLVGPNGICPNSTLAAASKIGNYGVDVFFGISGFLICSRLLSERSEKGRVNLKSFYIRRTFRIVPPLLGYLAVVGLLGAGGVIDLGLREYASCFVFLRNYIPEYEDGLYTRHFWSLAIEEHFYLIWPGLLVLLSTVRRARWAAFGLATLVVIWRGLDWRFGIVSWLFPDAPGNAFRTDTRLDGLLFGCWSALLVAEPAWRVRLTRWLVPAVWWLLVGLLVASVGVRLPVARLWPALLIPLVLLGTVLRPERPVSRFLEWPPLRWVGRMSYSLYIWQQLFLVPRPGPTPLGPLQTFPLDWLAVLACAIASYYLIERPAIRLGHRLSRT